MEDIPQTPQVEQNPAQQIQQNINESTIEQKEKELEKKKHKFMFFFISFMIFTVVVVLATAGIATYQYIQKKSSSDFKTVPEPVVVQPKEEEIRTYKVDNPNLKIVFTYPKEAKTIENRGVYYSTDDTANTTAEKLSEGYIFKVTQLQILGRNLDSITEVKRKSFELTCPEGFSTSVVNTTTLDSTLAKSFEVFNCDSDYKITYVQKFGFYYEILQMYKGGIGFKQQYKSATEEILSSFQFYSENTNNGPYITYENKSYGISFKYPKEMKPDCCEVPKPSMLNGNNIEHLVTVGELDGNALGVFIERSYQSQNFNDYLNKQKTLLTDDYKVIKGVAPITLVEDVMLGDYKATVLSGFSWQGNDLIYMQLPSKKGILIISVKSTPNDVFKQTMTEIFSSFNFSTL